MQIFRAAVKRPVIVSRSENAQSNEVYARPDTDQVQSARNPSDKAAIEGGPLKALLDTA